MLFLENNITALPIIFFIYWREVGGQTQAGLNFQWYCFVFSSLFVRMARKQTAGFSKQAQKKNEESSPQEAMFSTSDRGCRSIQRLS
jgi:hypothetical protein